MLKFSANISMLWRELPFSERLARAAEAGFAAVEFLWPTGESLDQIVRARERARMDVVLFNVEAGDTAAGERGYMNDPARRDEWRRALTIALDLARRLECPRLNCLVGNDIGTLSRTEQLAIVRENLARAIPQAESAHVTLLIEALNTFDTPGYLLSSTANSVALMDSFAPSSSHALRLQYDVYHMQRMGEDVVSILRMNMARIGHVQIADAPGRHQPGTGEIPWKSVLGALEELDYDGYVGLEYLPLGTTEASLAFLPVVHRQGCRTKELNFWVERD